jgi:glutathione S-transferase
MTAPFRLYGAELSPYSVKVRSYLRFKGVEFEWMQRSATPQEEFTRHAKLPLVPLLVDADDNAMQDSTPIIEALERTFAEPSIIPDEPALAFAAALLEDYADEWLNKAMFHYRWTYPDDQESAARRIVEMLFAGAAVVARACSTASQPASSSKAASASSSIAARFERNSPSALAA